MTIEADQKEPSKITTVKLPESLVANLGAVADQEHRSRNSQIVLFLREAVSQWDASHGWPLSAVA